ncbi:dUTP diphosphatase [Spiroplasma sabaudiense Ar-1343]|uniref:dUTP diphosphatase n=1 Tax=Spiroplasma sabaudiense Ar-1343 TaxID=1276257 RepID=W6AAZ0_9MOLU|nr:dUTP diphosphatase [Spiroplasma sabaudiense]AHI54025.1 dUTP diphosphatase [Spiroplasma sabaudiense Ar-1343]
MLKPEILHFLAQQQRRLDDFIYKKKNIKFDSTISNKKIIAFFVELGEFINEEKSFKFWSQKPSSERSVLLEEYIDGIHFIVSIGNEVGYNFLEYPAATFNKNLSIEIIYFNIIQSLASYILDKTVFNYQNLLRDFLTISQAFDFTEEEIIGAYNKKNKINFNRQEENY